MIYHHYFSPFTMALNPQLQGGRYHDPNSGCEMGKTGRDGERIYSSPTLELSAYLCNFFTEQALGHTVRPPYDNLWTSWNEYFNQQGWSSRPKPNNI
jgi:hypothetical protein